MDLIPGMTAYDMVVVGLFALLIGRGIWLGFLKQVTGLLALYLGFFAASRYHDRILPVLRDISENPKVVFLTSYLILFVATYVVAMLIGKLLRHIIQLTIAGWFDRMLGAAVGFAKGVILVVLMHLILGAILAPGNQLLRSCLTCDVLNGAADITRQLIRDEDVRKALIQQKPAISLDAVKKYLVPSGEKPASPADKTPVPPSGKKTPAPAGSD